MACFTLQPTATPAANSHPAPHINRFLWPLLHPTATPRPHINGFLWPLLQPTGTPGPHIKTLQSLQTLSRLPALLQPTGIPGPHIGFLWASKSAVCPAPQGPTSMASSGRPSLPFGRPKTVQTFKTLQTKRLAVCQPSCSQQASQGHTSMASYGRPSLPFARPQTPKTLQTLQTLKTLQTLTNRKTLQTLTWHASPCSQQPPLQPTATPRHTSIASYGHSCIQPPPQGHTSMASYGHSCSQQAPQGHTSKPSKASKRLAVCQPACSQQASQGHTSMASSGRPSLPFGRPKTVQTFKTLQTLQSLQTLSRLPALLQPTGIPGPHINGFLWASKSAVCPP